MRVHARKLFLALGLALAVAAALVGNPSGATGYEQLKEFDDFKCPADCPIGADECCAILPPICSDGSC